MMWTRTRKCCVCASVSCLVISVLSLTVSLLLYFLLPSFMKSYINKELLILPGNAPYVQLEDPMLPIYKDIYFFNITNPESFSKGSQPPKIVEKGPYSFREIRKKFFDASSLNWNKTTLTYTQLKTYHFSPNTSGRGLKEDDIICTINVPLVAVIAQVLKLKEAVERDAAILLAKYIFSHTNAKLYICQPAVSLIFNYTDKLVKELHTNELLKVAKMNFPVDYVSLQFNASVDDMKPSVISTGVGNLDDIGQFHRWDGKQSLDIWYDKYANMINGTEGMLFKPHLREGEGVVAFVDDAFRSIPLGYVGKGTLKGFKVYRYELAEGVFDSAFKNLANARWGSWCPNGLFYLGAIIPPGVPVFGSKPRFLDCDSAETTDKVSILPPDRSKQDTYAYVYPMLGLTLQFSRSLQFNIQINYTSDFSELKHFDGTTYFPVFYASEHAELNEEVKRYILKQGVTEYRGANIAWKVIFGLLLLITAVGLLCAFLTLCKAFRARNRVEYVAINSD